MMTRRGETRNGNKNKKVSNDEIESYNRMCYRLCKDPWVFVRPHTGCPAESCGCKEGNNNCESNSIFVSLLMIAKMWKEFNLITISS